jgi:hypothetical protein
MLGIKSGIITHRSCENPRQYDSVVVMVSHDEADDARVELDASRSKTATSTGH